MRVVFKPMSGQGEILSIEGNCVIQQGELCIEGNEISGFLVTVFLAHYGMDEIMSNDRDDKWFAKAGQFRIIFEPLTEPGKV